MGGRDDGSFPVTSARIALVTAHTVSALWWFLRSQGLEIHS